MSHHASFSKFVFVACLSIILSACSSTPSNYHIEQEIEASTDDSIAKWRSTNNIGRDALVAIHSDGTFEIVEAVTRTRQIAQHPNPYVNDFVPCYVNMRGVYQANPVILQAPCSRDPERLRNSSTGFVSGIGFGSGGYRGMGMGFSFGF